MDDRQALAIIRIGAGPKGEPAAPVYASPGADANDDVSLERRLDLVIADRRTESRHALPSRFPAQIRQTDRLENLTKLVGDFTPDEFGPTGHTLGVRAVNHSRRPHGPLHSLDDGFKRDLRCSPREHIAAAWPPLPRDQARSPETLKNLLEVTRRNPLPLADQSDLNGLTEAVVGQVEKPTNRVVDL